ncbi:TetR/AcrR family transcriptional regulator [Actinocrispum wychmicini]|uniref:TetR family transcriptional regulator n=1 Tax=Actinocrispum wychmicini TaxID=1213861 RepID=A0A4R2JZ32_9PSEU|nr:TetR/AcrR family transcriptional regulator [Actinocrispum wychmicini]TCO64542.1 TetR family transcriptional regulator [Actinocrispum wychmicini]
MAATRRRGEELERAILDAVWLELSTVGYANLTMESVAHRAGTSKPVLYRRWSNRVVLVLAALRDQVTPLGQDLPDTGELRGDLLALLNRAATRYREFDHDLLQGLIGEFPHLQTEIFEIAPAAVETLLARAVARGEIAAAPVTQRVARLPLDLVRHELVITHEPVPDHVLAEIVDDIFLPLIRARRDAHNRMKK